MTYENVKFEGGEALVYCYCFSRIDNEKVEVWIEKLMGCDLLPETDIITLCKKAKEVFNQVNSNKGITLTASYQRW